MRENRTYGSEGGEGQILPDPYPPARHGVHHAARKCAWPPPSPPPLRPGPSPAVRERGDPARSAGWVRVLPWLGIRNRSRPYFRGDDGFLTAGKGAFFSSPLNGGKH